MIGLRVMVALSAVALFSVPPAIAATAPALTDVQVIASYKPKGPVSCTLRFASPKGEPTLGLQGRFPQGSNTQRAFFILGALPPFLSGKGGAIRDIRLQAGGLRSATLKGAWSHGSAGNNSSIAIDAEVPLSTSLRYIAGGGPAKISFDLATGTKTFTFDLGGTERAMPFFGLALADRVGGQASRPPREV